MPPHGQENIENLQSIFEVAHLRDSAIFLDTQCEDLYFLELQLFMFYLYRPHASSNW